MLADQTRIQQVEQRITCLANHRPAHRQTIVTRPVVLPDSVNANTPLPCFPKTESQKEWLSKALRSHFLLANLADTEMTSLVNAMEREQVPVGTMIIQQGEDATTNTSYLYVIEEGKVAFYQTTTTGTNTQKQVGTAASGEIFGELALLYDAPRAASCVAFNEVAVWKVQAHTFRTLMAQHAHQQYTQLYQVVRQIPLFQSLDDATVSRFVNSMTTVHWEAKQRIVQKGQVGNVFYILIQGHVRIHDIGLGDSEAAEQRLGPGEWFGERALLTGEPRAANVTAVTDATTLAMDRKTFETTLGPLRELLELEMRRHFLSSLPIFNTSDGKPIFSQEELSHLAQRLNEICYRKGDKLAQAGHTYTLNLWIIRHGRLLVYSNKPNGKLFNLQSGDYFGDKSIGGDPQHISSHTAVVEENLTTWVLTRQDMEAVIGDIGRLGQAKEYRKRNASLGKSILFRDLEKRRMLGKGAFGKVWMVAHKKTGTAYALKQISKYKILKSGQQDSVLREKELLYLLHHPFLLHLVSSYQDSSHLYLLLPVIPGGELYSVLQKQGGHGLSARNAAFYGACIIEGLGHLHQRSIAFRDLKLENVLIDESGYCVIVDFGFAKIVTGRTFTLVGTPEYLAPEIIMAKGHDKAVDYWSYGVLVYELLLGTSPFFARGSPQLEMFKRIVLGKYKIPSQVDALAQRMISALLERTESQRLGNLANGYLDVRNHPWFDSFSHHIDYKRLLGKEVEAPWVPSINGTYDSSNFDDYSADERDVDMDRHLSQDEQGLFAGF